MYTHPYFIPLRTYLLSLSLSLGPALIPLIASLFSSRHKPSLFLVRLKRLLKNELAYDGFAFAITLSVGGGAALHHIWRQLETLLLDVDQHSKRYHPTLPSLRSVLQSLRQKIRPLFRRLSQLSPAQKLFITHALSSFVGIILLQSGRNRRLRTKHEAFSIHDPLIPTVTTTPSSRGSSTLDLTLLLLVRALDAATQRSILSWVDAQESSQPSEFKQVQHGNVGHSARGDKKERRAQLTTRIDALVFWACSARIMWCWFYEPQRLPRSYVKWINSLANVDDRLLRALQLIREGKWSYVTGSPTYPNILIAMSRDLNYPPIWGDPLALPAKGGPRANVVWKALGVNNRPNLGGLPCEIVHGGANGVGGSSSLAGSCVANSSYRGARAFLQALALYLPVHFLPPILNRPKSLLHLRSVLAHFLGAVRSATFLSTFVASYWFAVCLTRTLVLARLFPSISHDFWDGPYGCIMAGCLTCGSSIWIENGRRRGEMALYVLPRAIRACIPESWVRRRGGIALLIERLTFATSLSYLLLSGVYHPEALRGLSRWALTFVMDGSFPSLSKPKTIKRNPH